MLRRNSLPMVKSSPSTDSSRFTASQLMMKMVQKDATHILPAMKVGDELQRREITATEKFSAAPLRYTEASLVKKLEDLGIGRPSTYAPTISTIQQREYVQKGDKKGVERSYTIDSLKGIKVTQKVKKEIAGNEKENCCLQISESLSTTS